MSRCCTVAWVGIFGALPLFGSSIALAQETTWYQIEVVVFANRDTATGASEVWPIDPGAFAAESPIELASSTSVLSVDTEAAAPAATSAVDSGPSGTSTELSGTPEEALGATPGTGATQTLDADGSLGLRAFVRLPDEELQLVKLRERLNSSPGYRTLAHIGWRQPLTRQEKPRFVHVSSNSRRKHTALMATPDANIATATASTMAPATPLLTLDGAVAVTLGRYLHVDVDLVYAPDEPLPPAPAIAPTSPLPPESNGQIDASAAMGTPSAAAPSPTPAIPVYRLVQSRRMRSNELHYLDHPLFGVVIQATPVKLGNP